MAPWPCQQELAANRPPTGTKPNMMDRIGRMSPMPGLWHLVLAILPILFILLGLVPRVP